MPFSKSIFYPTENTSNPSQPHIMFVELFGSHRKIVLTVANRVEAFNTSFVVVGGNGCKSVSKILLELIPPQVVQVTILIHTFTSEYMCSSRSNNETTVAYIYLPLPMPQRQENRMLDELWVMWFSLLSVREARHCQSHGSLLAIKTEQLTEQL